MRAMLAGADDNMVHAQISIQNNRARNCGSFAGILGSKSVQVVGNQIHHTAALPSTLFSMVGISRYTTTSEPVEDIVCADNHFTSEVSSGTTFVTHAIELGWDLDSPVVRPFRVSEIITSEMATRKACSPKIV
jgi:hypothetical protein